MFPDGGAIFFFMVRHSRPNFCQFSQQMYKGGGASTVAPQPPFGATTAHNLCF